MVLAKVELCNKGKQSWSEWSESAGGYNKTDKGASCAPSKRTVKCVVKSCYWVLVTQCELSSQQKKKAAVCKVCNDPEISVFGKCWSFKVNALYLEQTSLHFCRTKLAKTRFEVMLARCDLSVWEAGVFGITMQRTEKDGVNMGWAVNAESSPCTFLMQA